MDNLVEQLEREHAVIMEVLDKINKLGIGSNEAQKLLKSAKHIFLAHLNKEDTHLYPLLHKAAEKDISLQRTLVRFASNMDEISRAAAQFFDKYSEGGSGVEFAFEFGQLRARLSQRIYNEENVLYTKFSQLRI